MTTPLSVEMDSWKDGEKTEELPVLTPMTGKHIGFPELVLFSIISGTVAFLWAALCYMVIT